MSHPLLHIARQVGAPMVRGLRADAKQLARGWRWGRRPLVPRSAEPHMLPTSPETFRTDWARTPIAGLIRSGIQRFGMIPLLHATATPVVRGQDVLSGLHGPVLFVANHASHLDTLLIMQALPPSWRKRTAVAAAADYFFDTWWRATGSAMAFNTFPIERRSGTLSATPGDLLADNWNVVVFPEGTRSPDGWPRPFRHGAAMLSVRHQIPVIPIGIRGSYAAMPRGRNWPVPGRPPVVVRFGPPLVPTSDTDIRSFGGQIEAAVAQLLTEDRDTWWSAQQAASLAESTPASGGPATGSARATSAHPDLTGPAAKAPSDVPATAAAWRRTWAQTAHPKTNRPRRSWR